MSKFIREWHSVILALIAMGCGAAITAESMSSKVRNNTYSDHQYQLITEHISQAISKVVNEGCLNHEH